MNSSELRLSGFVLKVECCHLSKQKRKYVRMLHNTLQLLNTFLMQKTKSQEAPSPFSGMLPVTITNACKSNDSVRTFNSTAFFLVMPLCTPYSYCGASLNRRRCCLYLCRSPTRCLTWLGLYVVIAWYLSGRSLALPS